MATQSFPDTPHQTRNLSFPKRSSFAAAIAMIFYSRETRKHTVKQGATLMNINELCDKPDHSSKRSYASAMNVLASVEPPARSSGSLSGH